MSFGYKNELYNGSIGSRTHVHGLIVTANDCLPEDVTGFHHEAAYNKKRPDAVFFYCDIAPASGGQTPVAYSPDIYKKMLAREPDFVARMEKEGIIYTNIMPGENDSNKPLSSEEQLDILGAQIQVM